MKTLILNGSPRANGDTSVLLNRLIECLDGEIVKIDCYQADVRPCIDCRWCENRVGCAIDDDMTRIYEAIEESDCIVLATPMYHSLPTPPLLNVFSRFQTLYLASRRKERPSAKPKCGGMIIVGGGSGGEDLTERTLRNMMRSMRVKELAPVAVSLHTDQIPVSEDEEAMNSVAAMADFFNAFPNNPGNQSGTK